MSAKPIGGTLAKILKPAVRKRGLAAADLIMTWRDIAGPQFAECTLPDRIVWPRVPDGMEGEAVPGTLVVRCAGPAAVFLQHEAPLLVERVNTFLGWYAVDRIKIVQGPIGEAVPAREGPPPEIPEEKREEVAETVAGVSDDRLRRALSLLGKNVVANAIAKARADDA